jgi:hypothetical protein
VLVKSSKIGPVPNFRISIYGIPLQGNLGIGG